MESNFKKILKKKKNIINDLKKENKWGKKSKVKRNF